MNKTEQIKKRVKKTYQENSNGGRGNKIDMQQYFDKIKGDLMLGYSIHKSCILNGVPYRTVKRYYEKSGKWQRKIDKVSTDACRRARINFINAINEGDLGASEKWLKDKENMFRDKLDVKADLTVNDVIGKLKELDEQPIDEPTD